MKLQKYAGSWADHARHRAEVISQTGQWIGLLNENGEPLCDLPPVIKLEAPQTKGEPASLTLTVQLTVADGRLSPLADDLIAEGIGAVNTAGSLIPQNVATRFIAIERPGLHRRVYRITHCRAIGDRYAPQLLEIYGVDELDILACLPCPSMPSEWTSDVRVITRDKATVWHTPRKMAMIAMAKVADGFTVQGRAAATIRDLIADSLGAYYRVLRITHDYPVVVAPAENTQNSPMVVLRPQDRSIWDEIAPTALAAKVAISVRMAWPGEHIPAGCFPPSNSIITKPTFVIYVKGQ